MSSFRVPRIPFRKSASGLWYPAVSSPEFMRMHVIVPIVQLIDHSRSANDHVLRSAPKNILHAWSPIVANARHRTTHWATVSVWSLVFKPHGWKFCFRRSEPSIPQPSVKRLWHRVTIRKFRTMKSTKRSNWNDRCSELKGEGRAINWKFSLLLIKIVLQITHLLSQFRSEGEIKLKNNGRKDQKIVKTVFVESTLCQKEDWKIVNDISVRSELIAQECKTVRVTF